MISTSFIASLKINREKISKSAIILNFYFNLDIFRRFDDFNKKIASSIFTQSLNFSYSIADYQKQMPIFMKDLKYFKPFFLLL